MTDQAYSLMTYRIAFASMQGMGIDLARKLLDVVGDEARFFGMSEKELRSLTHGRSKIYRDDYRGDCLRRAAVEEAFIGDHSIRTTYFTDDDYPSRLSEAADAPAMIYTLGQCDLESKHVISVVGTRHATQYGMKFCDTLIGDLAQRLPDLVVVSGLAYGVDIHAHQEALANGMKTVAVLAHGLDTLYPPAHRDTANVMITHGGLVTEYMTRTQPDKLNFVRRNRITAGLCDATILVESARKGGGLITTRIAKEYNRDVFAFPGPVGAPYSEGCNNLIRSCGAGLITSAADFVEEMGWEKEASLIQARAQGIERQLFPNLSADEQRIVNILQATNDLRQDIIAVKTGLSSGSLTALLFQLEMKGVVKAYAGGTYHLMA